ncbi:MAG: Hpt domain-containing protein [Alphaproteobacteria bacterium]
MSEDAFTLQMAALRARFTARVTADRAMLACLHPPFDPATRDLVRAVAHRLAGSAGTFGYPGAGAAALRLEDACESGDDGEIGRTLDDTLAALAAIVQPPD